MYISQNRNLQGTVTLDCELKYRNKVILWYFLSFDRLAKEIPACKTEKF